MAKVKGHHPSKAIIFIEVIILPTVLFADLKNFFMIMIVDVCVCACVRACVRVCDRR